MLNKILCIVGFLIFIWSLSKRFSLIFLGKPDPEDRFKPFFKRISAMLKSFLGFKRVLIYPHNLYNFILFWTFFPILFVANLEVVLMDIFKVHFVFPHFICLLFNAFSIIAFLIILKKILFFKKENEPLYLLFSIELLIIFYFMTTISFVMVNFREIDPKLHSLFSFLHLLMFLTILNIFPYTEKLYILCFIPISFFQSLKKPITLAREEFKRENTFGVGRIDLFTWKDLFDTYACAKCKRCEDICPATNTKKPLNPREVIHNIKINLLKNGPSLKKGNPLFLSLIGEEKEGSNLEEALWSCTTCNACMEVCPMFIEHTPKIVKMRRHLVEMEAKFPEGLFNLFENIESRSNPWGIAPSERTKWAIEREVKQFTSGETEYLLYVGCAGSFDSRNKQITLALTSILNGAGISWGILGKDEKCCGDSLRRLGNEFVFENMAKENVSLLKEKGVKKIITQCPHCFSTLKNDYKDYGLKAEVFHHSEFILYLLKQGNLKLKYNVASFGKIVFHDPCYLGRYNEIYEAPREVIKIATGKATVEMKKNKKHSFCCGAGGGRMWMEENLGTRINLTRVKEAITKNPNTISVACPYCMTMFEDGLKDKKAENISVRDIAEVVVEGLQNES